MKDEKKGTSFGAEIESELNKLQEDGRAFVEYVAECADDDDCPSEILDDFERDEVGDPYTFDEFDAADIMTNAPREFIAELEEVIEEIGGHFSERFTFLNACHFAATRLRVDAFYERNDLRHVWNAYAFRHAEQESEDRGLRPTPEQVAEICDGIRDVVLCELCDEMADTFSDVARIADEVLDDFETRSQTETESESADAS